MNILCIANDIGHSAAGIVFDTIIKELSLTNHVYVICPHVSGTYTDYKSVTILPSIEFPKDLPWSLSMLSMQLFGLNITDRIGSKKYIKEIGYNSLPNIDCILSFVSQKKYFGLLLGKYLAQNLKIKWAVYCVDAIPAPYPWTKNYLLRKRIECVFSRLVKNCDLFISANPLMLKYQLKSMRGFRGKTDVVYTPSQTITLAKTSSKSNNKHTFLYTGSIYGMRRIDQLIDAYRRLLNDFSNTKIVFVGYHQSNTYAQCQDLINLGKIEVYPSNEDVSQFYSEAAILIDINADIANDVFLSSKIATYLSLKKPIICLSGKNSPASKIFTNDETILHCEHSVDDIYAAMKKAIDMIGIESTNRDYYIQMFSAQHNCQKLINSITSIG